MTTYCLNPNQTWLAVYNLNTATMPTNNVVFSDLIADLSANGTSATIKAGEGSLFSVGMIATIEQLNAEGKATAREVILINGITDNVLSITRGYEKCVMDDTASPKVMGNTTQAFTSGARISVYVSKALLNGVQTRLKQVNCPCNTKVYRDALAVSSCVESNCDAWRDVLYKEKARRCFNDNGFGDGSDGDCIIEENTFLDASCEYNFKNLTICSGVLVRFEGEGVPRINVQRTFINLGTIDLRGGTFVGACSRTDNLTGCTISNNSCKACYDAMCYGCGGSGNKGGRGTGCNGCNAIEGCGGDGGNGGEGRYCYLGNSSYGCVVPGGAGGVADGYNGGNGGAGAYGGGNMFYAATGGGGGGGGGYYTGNGGNGGAGGGTSQGTAIGCGGNGGNGGIWGRGGTGGVSGTHSSCAGASSCENRGGNGGNGYIGGNGGNGCGGGSGSDRKKGSGGDGGKGVICGGNGGQPYAGNEGATPRGGKGGDAINNMYGLIIHACEFYNVCIEAQGGKGGNGGSASKWSSGDYICGGNGGCGGCGANGGNISIAYSKLTQQGDINISGGSGGTGGWTYLGWKNCASTCVKCPDAPNGTDGYCVVCKPF